VQRLEAIVKAQKEALLPDEAVAEELTPEQALFETALAGIDNRLNALRVELAETRTELTTLDNAISQSSANDITLAALERDFEVIQARYETAVTNLNDARISVRIEETAQGQRVTEIESANVPRIPAGPNRIKIIGISLVIGSILAGMYFAALELLNRTVRRPEEIISRFNITPLTTIPYMESQSARFFRRSGLVVTSTVVLVGVPTLLWYVDTYYLPLELVVQKGLDRLGLG